jgi:hypothetical protein
VAVLGGLRVAAHEAFNSTRVQLPFGSCESFAGYACFSYQLSQAQNEWANHLLKVCSKEMNNGHIDLCMRVLLRKADQKVTADARQQLWDTYNSLRVTPNPGFGRLMGLTTKDIFEAFEAGLPVSASCSDLGLTHEHDTTHAGNLDHRHGVQTL